MSFIDFNLSMDNKTFSIRFISLLIALFLIDLVVGTGLRIVLVVVWYILSITFIFQRLNDLNKSKFYSLIILIPVVGIVYLIHLMLKKS